MSQNNDLVLADSQTLRKALQLTDPASVHADPDKDTELARQADTLVSALLARSADPAGQNQARNAVETLAMDLQREASHRSQMLRQPIRDLAKKSEDGGEVANALIDLKMNVEALDPARFDFEAGWLSRVAGYLPGIGTPIKRYFSQYEAASTTIDAIINSLKAGQEQLKRDNMTLGDDQTAMRALTHKLEKAIKLGELIDKGLADKLETELLADDPRHKFIQEELLFPLRQRIQDLQQQLLVNQQGYITTEMIIRNNKELIRGVNRALNVTINALQVAVALALAMANQRIVLDKVKAINTTTENLIAGTAERLKTQGVEIHKQASGAMLDIDVLKKSFADIRSALDDVSRYRQEALPRMAQNILDMNRLAEESEAVIQRMEGAQAVARDFPIEVID